MSSDRAAAPALAFEAVEFRYARAPVLRGLSVEVRSGEFVGLLGPNGSGKTTLLRLITGAVRPQRGAVFVDGRPRDAVPRRALARRIALVPQQLEVAFDFTVEELVLLGRAPHVRWLRGETAADRAAARAAIAQTDVVDLAGRLFRSLSGGERQRVVLAMALAQEPRILLLDEPTNNLDIAHQAALFDLVRRLNREAGLTVLAAIHDLNLAALYCDRLLLLHHGVLVADGPPAAVLTEDRLARYYGARARVFPHPVTGRPQVALLPADASPPACPLP